MRHHGTPARPAYVCARRASEYGESSGQHIAGAGLDAFVSQQVLVALEPAALDLSLAAAVRVEQERAQVMRLWRQRRERAAYEVARATLRHALQQLVREGLLQRVRGHGTYVAESAIAVGTARRRYTSSGTRKR